LTLNKAGWTREDGTPPDSSGLLFAITLSAMACTRLVKQWFLHGFKLAAESSDLRVALVQFPEKSPHITKEMARLLRDAFF
jgi:hypothetical protein